MDLWGRRLKERYEHLRDTEGAERKVGVESLRVELRGYYQELHNLGRLDASGLIRELAQVEDSLERLARVVSDHDEVARRLAAEALGSEPLEPLEREGQWGTLAWSRMPKEPRRLTPVIAREADAWAGGELEAPPSFPRVASRRNVEPERAIWDSLHLGPEGGPALAELIELGAHEPPRPVSALRPLGSAPRPAFASLADELELV